MSPIYSQQAGRARLVMARDIAARMLYRAEIALSDAHDTGVDEWVDAANERLHQAVLRYEAALSQLSSFERSAAA
jgi:DUF971 family protein